MTAAQLLSQLSIVLQLLHTEEEKPEPSSGALNRSLTSDMFIFLSAMNYTFPAKVRAFCLLITKATSTAGNCPLPRLVGKAVKNPTAKFRVSSVGVRHCNPAANPTVPRREPHMGQNRTFNVYAVTNGLEMESGPWMLYRNGKVSKI